MRSPVVAEPASRPCRTCPYRTDCPSGLWDPAEYAKLAAYDLPTPQQPHRVFVCHDHPARVCAGWAGCHDGANLMALRVALVSGDMTRDQYERTVDYVSPVPLFPTGAAAAAHGLRDVDTPGPAAHRAAHHLTRRRGRRQERAS